MAHTFSETAVKGLQAEIKALQDEQKPLNSEVVELKKASTKNVLKYEEAKKRAFFFQKGLIILYEKNELDGSP